MNEEVNRQIKNTEENSSKLNTIIHKDTAIQKLNALLSSYINNPTMIDKADKLAYWIEDYCRLLNFEKEFNPKYFKKY